MPAPQKLFTGVSIKRLFNSILIRLINKIDFISLARKTAHSEKGRPFLDRFSALPQNWQKAADISGLAVEMTLHQLEKEGVPADQNEITALIKQIEIQYDRDIHINAAASLGILFDHLFSHQDPDLPFVSMNKRDLAHLDTLKAYQREGLGVVYLINHSSHLDEFLVDLLWQYLGLGLPVFAAGQNMMKIKSIARLLMIGSYVVLRQGAGRKQMSALYNYCKAVSMCGGQQGIFLEAWRGGARSRDGSLRYPKRLVTLRGAIDIEGDLVIQPVSLSFSIVPEDLVLCARKSPVSWFRGLGLFKTLAGMLLHPRTFLWRSAENLYGRAYISMPEPFLLNGLKQAHQEDKTGIHLDEFVALSCIRQIAKSKKLMASQITAQAIMNLKKGGAKSLEEAVEKQIQDSRAYHERTFGCPPDFEGFILRHTAKDIAADGVKTLKKRGILKRWAKDRHGLPGIKNPAGLSYYATHADRRIYSPTADQNIVVMGAGNWGFALACLIGSRILEDKAYDNASLTIFDARTHIADQMGLNRNGPGRFSESLLPKNVFVTSDFSSAFRKASDVIIALKPSDFEQNFRQMLELSTQELNVMIATRGFVPEHNTLPFVLAQDLAGQSGRNDIHLFTLTGPVSPENLVTNQMIRGVVAGPEEHINALVDLFDPSVVDPFQSDDPIGVQTADILSRIYAVWINFLQSSGRADDSTMIGYITAAAADEACALAVHLGGSKNTFDAGSIPWTASFTALALDGLWKEFGRKIGKAVKKGATPKKAFEKIKLQYEKEGTKIQAIDDMRMVLACAARFQLEMPVLAQAHKTFLEP